MSFFRTDVANSPVTDLLDRLENQPITYSHSEFPPPKIPALREFLEEEDLLRECRAENNRLIAYLSKPEIVMDLVQTMFELPVKAGPARPDATGSTKSATSIDLPQPVSEGEQQKEHHLKHAHIASEVLTCDNKMLCEAILGHDEALERVFHYLESVGSGQLHTCVAQYFSKLIISLLKTHHDQTIEQLSKRRQRLVVILLKHIDNLAIADLTIHLLDSPEPNDPYMYNQTNVSSQAQYKKPTQEALDLLAGADILSGLAERFVKASTDEAEHDMNHFDAATDDNDTTNAENSVKTNDALSAENQSKDGKQPDEADQQSPTGLGILAANDARLGKHPRDTSGSDRPTQKARSLDGDDSSSPGGDDSPCMKDSASDGDVSEEKTIGIETSEAPSSSSLEPESADGSSAAMQATNSTNATVGAQPSEMDAMDQEELNARRRRLREETMSNVTSTILNLTKRMLQLPMLGCEIPQRLNIFAMNDVVVRLLDAGLYAVTSGESELPPLPKASASGPLDERAVHVHRVQTFASGGFSPLMHVLRLFGHLLSTDANQFRDDEEDPLTDHSMSAGSASSAGSDAAHAYGAAAAANQRHGSLAIRMLMLNARAGEGPGTAGSGSNQQDLQRRRRDGDKLEPTCKLEAELELRFERLAQLLDVGEYPSDDTSSGAKRVPLPLGSLRLTLAEFFIACIKTAGPETVAAICELGVPRTLLSLFERYKWSSMLHGVVTAAIISCLDGGEAKRAGRVAWFEAGLVPWLIDAWGRNMDGDSKEEERRSVHCGYLGHLLHIGNALKEYLDEYAAATAAAAAVTGGMGESGNNISLGIVGPSEEDMARFKEFSIAELIPAVQRESRPLVIEHVDAMGGLGFTSNVNVGNVHVNGMNMGMNIGMQGGGKHAADEDEDEATEVLDMEGIQFVEGPVTQGFIQQGVDDDEGEIKPVDTTSLDEDAVNVVVGQMASSSSSSKRESNRPTKVVEHVVSPVQEAEAVTTVDDDLDELTSVDHDIPAELRRQLEEQQRKQVGGSKSIGGIRDENVVSTSRTGTGSANGGQGADVNTKASCTNRNTSVGQQQQQHDRQMGMEEKRDYGEIILGRINKGAGSSGGGRSRKDDVVMMDVHIDDDDDVEDDDDDEKSSSDDDGTYVAYVDDRKEMRERLRLKGREQKPDQEQAKEKELIAKVEQMTVGGSGTGKHLGPGASLDVEAVVTEIDDVYDVEDVVPSQMQQAVSNAKANAAKKGKKRNDNVVVKGDGGEQIEEEGADGSYEKFQRAEVPVKELEEQEKKDKEKNGTGTRT